MNDEQMTGAAGNAELDHEEASGTARERERHEEDSQFLPVVVKRTDQSIRHPEDVLSLAIQEGLEQSRRPALSLLLSAVSAGAILGFAAMSVGVMSAVAGGDSEGAARVLIALVYPLGFILCLMSGTQLFTEHTALAVYPVLDGKTKLGAMVRLWALVLAGNMVGCALGASLLAAAEGVVGAAEGYRQLAEHLIHFSAWDTLISGLLAGWLMALGGWLMLATLPDVSQIAAIYVTTFLIGLGGFHHSIAGASELFAAYWTGAPITATAIAATLGAAALGNLIGGSLFVAILNYGHIRQTQLDEPDSQAP